MSLVLAFDTSTSIMTLALVKVKVNGEYTPIASVRGDGLLGHSSSLAPAIDELLKKNVFEFGNIDLLAVGRGPGSFTGLRTGLALAKGLSAGLCKPLLGLSSLTVLAAAQKPSGAERELVAPLIDARRGEIFTALHSLSALDCSPEMISDILAVKPKDLFALLENLSLGGQGPIRLTGPALELVGPLPQGFVSGQAIAPKAEVLAVLAAKAFFEDRLDDFPPAPIYGRSPDIFKTWLPPKRLSLPTS
ncbi:MAG: tRNA (adenosine(37)-N6)-threonylcarbamoyltransferase complex dimerization subunit type 1 TsaB [Deltaproteobacteria bacterium]|jgi:tRNA threonylcarbamoyladenosine biosynthesis protein TsaB|nr:tRNA (adenosine(37)-N6)-threonylcarbamoyltransferase complex dimerization subunit type 1 TsaB [Deltaproteobacteria bacterium]